MLTAPIEIAGYDNEGRADAALGESEEETDGRHAVEAGGSTKAHLNGTPRNNGRSDDGYDWQAAEQVCGGVFGDKLTEVKQGHNPGELPPSELEVLS